VQSIIGIDAASMNISRSAPIPKYAAVKISLNIPKGREIIVRIIITAAEEASVLFFMFVL